MAVFTYIVCAVVWSTTWFAIRLSIGEGAYPTYAAAALRFTLASAVLGALWALGLARPGPRTRRELAWLGAAGVANAVNYMLIYTAEQHITGGLTAVLFGLFPLVVAAFAVATRTERVTPSMIAGSLIGIAGVAIIMWDQLAVSRDQAVAVLLALGGVVLSAVYTVIFKRIGGGMHPLALTAAFCVATTLVLWPMALALDDQPIPWPPPLRPTLAVAYLGVFGSAIVFVAYAALVKRVSLMTVSTLVFINPTLAVVVDVVFEDQRLQGRSYAGIAVVLAGVAVSVLARARARPSSASS